MKFIISILLLLIGTLQKPATMEDEAISFLALGDSYTIGESVKEYDCWPAQLVQRLRKDDIPVEEPQIVAKTGWTTDELISAIDQKNIRRTYDLVTLLIGVNNQYRGYPIKQYEKEFDELLSKAIRYAAGSPENVFVISIPDYGVTPFATQKELDESTISQEINKYNAIAERLATAKNANFTSITAESKDAKNDPELIAEDGLHPSKKMYVQWVEAIYTSIYDNLSTR